jgi:hypothetical protein
MLSDNSAQCHLWLYVTNTPFMLSVIMLKVIMLSVIAPLGKLLLLQAALQATIRCCKLMKLLLLPASCCKVLRKAPTCCKLWLAAGGYRQLLQAGMTIPAARCCKLWLAGGGLLKAGKTASVTNCCKLLQAATSYYKLLQAATSCYKLLQAATSCSKLLQAAPSCYKLLQAVAECCSLLACFCGKHFQCKRPSLPSLNRFRPFGADDYEDFPMVPPLLRLSYNLPEEEYFKAPGKRYCKHKKPVR